LFVGLPATFTLPPSPAFEFFASGFTPFLMPLLMPALTAGIFFPPPLSPMSIYDTRSAIARRYR
jgi:hypothetical protein